MTRCVVTRALPSKLVKLSLKVLFSSKWGASISRLLAGQTKRFATNGPSTRGRRAVTRTWGVGRGVRGEVGGRGGEGGGVGGGVGGGGWRGGSAGGGGEVWGGG